MAINNEEKEILEAMEWDIAHWEDIDPIERAAADCRIQRACRFVLGVPLEAEGGTFLDYEALTGIIGEEYLLSQDEVKTAFDIAEERIKRE
jgi:hypothetical protein